ncbi:MAG: hypothetical protein NTY15_02815 [Planctomycetota bacterium]|nr:hypothetical protein [Planctomycetota bacterium]
MKPQLVSLTLFLAIGSAASCLAQGRDRAEPAKPKRAAHLLATKHLPNAIQIHERVISGGQPVGESAFRELSDLGIKTIVSVDGARPDVELAKKFGFRYVHLPHGYNGIQQERIEELAKAVRDLDGPIFIHCHHGKHRSPSAAAAACVAAGLIEPVEALPILKLAGTSENYIGLFESVGSATKLSSTCLDQLTPDFPETAKLPPMAEAMVELERTHDRMKRLSESGWKSLPGHPDLTAAHEALLLREHFTEMQRMEYATKQPQGFSKRLKESEADALLLEKVIRQWKPTSNSTSLPADVAEPFRRISTNCIQCHKQYRDVPIQKSR